MIAEFKTTDDLDRVVAQAKIEVPMTLNLTAGERFVLDDALRQYAKKYRGIEKRSRGGNGGYVARLAEGIGAKVLVERKRIYEEQK